MKKCNGCKRELDESHFTRKNKVYARCNDCSSKSSCKKNICETCGITACFNVKGLKWGRFCKTHKELGMVNVIDKLCEKDGCILTATFNYEGMSRKFCDKHKEEGMVNVKNKKCIYPDCKGTQTFNFKGEDRPLFCNNHKKEGMINIKSNRCGKDGCDLIPSFNYEGTSKGIFCSNHKEEGMIDVIHRTCEKEGCNSTPGFNYKGETRRRFCEEHKEDGMVNIKTKSCIEENCSIIPSYNFEGENKPLFCNIHKKEGMINIRTKYCEKDGCKFTASFNFKNINTPKYCEKHKENGMVNVKDKICEKEGCKTQCNFGYCGTSPSYCAQHKLDYMIYKPKRTCIGNDEEDSKDYAIYGKDEPLHCEDHKLQGEICWLVKKCSNCGRDKELLNKDNLCGICCDKPFYEESKRINKVKENIMVRYLRNNVKEGNEILADRIIDSMCNLYRPDILYDCGSHIVVVECDENQHKNYPWESCSLNRSLEHMEEKRMYEIMVAYGLPAIFLRWNPDTFNIKGEICKRYNNSKRLEILVKWVNYCYKMKVDSGVIYKKLFYDDYEENDMNLKVINEKELI
jgi:hypothetical protein